MSLKYKKGSLLDVLWIVVVIFALIITTIIASKIYSAYKSNVDMGTAATEIYQKGEIVQTGMDDIIIFALVGLALAALIGAFQLNTSPALFFISLFLIVITIIIAAAISDVYEEISENDTLSSEVDYYPKTNFVLKHLPLIILGFAALLAIVMFGVKAT